MGYRWKILFEFASNVTGRRGRDELSQTMPMTLIPYCSD